MFGKIPAKSPDSTGADNHVEQQLGVVLAKNIREGLKFLYLNVQIYTFADLTRTIKELISNLFNVAVYWREIKTPALPRLISG